MKRLTAENIAADLGLDAALEGKGRDSNPYSANYFLYKWWDLGWLECHSDDFGTQEIEMKYY